MIASLYIGNVMLLILNLPLVTLWVKLLAIPKPQLYAGILVIATLGAYSVHHAAGDLVLLTVIGVLGYVLRRIDAPVAPVMIGLILGAGRRSTTPPRTGDQRRRLERLRHAPHLARAVDDGGGTGRLGQEGQGGQGREPMITQACSVQICSTHLPYL